MTDDLLAPNQPFYSSERVEQRLREEIARLRAEVATARNSLAVADSALAALRKRVAESRPLFARYDKRMESPAAGFTGTIAIRAEDYDALRSLVVEG